jgi:hypothetical protein
MVLEAWVLDMDPGAVLTEFDVAVQTFRDCSFGLAESAKGWRLLV